MIGRLGVEVALPVPEDPEGGVRPIFHTPTSALHPLSPHSYPLLNHSCQSLSEKPKPQALLGLWPQPSK